MKINHYINNRIAAALLLLSLFLLPACSNEEDVPVVEPEQLYTVTLSLNPSTRGATTKASPDWATDMEDKDLEAFERYIKDCVVAIFQDGTFVSSLSAGIPNVEDKIKIDNENAEHSDNMHATKVGTATVSLPAGNYTFYAFANLSSLDKNESKEGTDLINKILTGDNGTLTPKELEELTVSLGNDPNRYNLNDAVYIPMSSYGEQKIVEADGSLDITLFRMLGKVTVSINNQTTKDLTLNKIEVGQFRRGGSIFLVPYGSGETSLDHLTQNDQNSFNPLFPKQEDGVSISSIAHKLDFMTEPETIETGKTNSYTFYEFETRSEQQDKSGYIGSMWIATDITDRDPSPRKLDFSFMRRNDWLNIPVLLSDVSTTIEFDMKHMPIGGLPATITIPEGLTIPQATFWTQDHGGDITITYTLNSISSLTNAKIAHRAESESYEEGESHPFTSAVLESNEDDLLIALPENNVAAPWLDETMKAFVLPKEDAESGSFTITAQELAKSAEARIRLNMVIEGTANGTTQTHKVVVPYTIIIKNKKDQDWVQGGN